MKTESLAVKIVIDSVYHRSQFDDWLAGGKIEFKSKECWWSAHDSGYGFGWEVEPINEDDWNEIIENEFNEITSLIKKCLYEHRTEYEFPPK